MKWNTLDKSRNSFSNKQEENTQNNSCLWSLTHDLSVRMLPKMGISCIAFLWTDGSLTFSVSSDSRHPFHHLNPAREKRKDRGISHCGDEFSVKLMSEIFLVIKFAFNVEFVLEFLSKLSTNSCTSLKLDPHKFPPLHIPILNRNQIQCE